MKKKILLLNLILLISRFNSFSQSVLISTPKAEFDGSRLTISYDLNDRSISDIFFIWVEIRKQDGTRVRASEFKGAVGDSITPGKDKKIVWIPDDDAVLIDEDVTVEIKGEKYTRSFNKGSMVLLSTAMPGLGQTKISKGKPWWLLGIASYGTLAGGFAVNSGYNKTYKLYLKETDPVERGDLFDKSQKQKNLSSALFITSAALWVGNIIWVSATPNKYKPLQHNLFSVVPSVGNQGRFTMLSYKKYF
jgi:hypothetical protein